jgi:hypothetical protein
MNKSIDITGKRFGKLIAIKKHHQDKYGAWYWVCVCECRNECIVRINNLTRRGIHSCGCSKYINYNDIIGKKIGNLFILEYIVNKKKYKCQCNCGNFTYVRRDKLVNKNTKSCGCSRKKIMGLSKTRLYCIWNHMKKRCFSKKAINYKYYGGRGIIVCDEWRSNFVSFYNWAMTNGYRDNLSIDRINNDGNYKPDNCRWATRSEQERNKNRK